jgi:hypothetical protein
VQYLGQRPLVLTSLHGAKDTIQAASSSARTHCRACGTDLQLSLAPESGSAQQSDTDTAHFFMPPINNATQASVAIKPITMESFDMCVTHKYSSPSHCAKLVVVSTH